MPAIYEEDPENRAPAFMAPSPAASQQIDVQPDGTKAVVEPKTARLFRWSFWVQIFHLTLMVVLFIVVIIVVIRVLAVLKRVEEKIDQLDRYFNTIDRITSPIPPLPFRINNK
jgi:hypothetical protein